MFLINCPYLKPSALAFLCAIRPPAIKLLAPACQAHSVSTMTITSLSDASPPLSSSQIVLLTIDDGLSGQVHGKLCFLTTMHLVWLSWMLLYVLFFYPPAATSSLAFKGMQQSTCMDGRPPGRLSLGVTFQHVAIVPVLSNKLIPGLSRAFTATSPIQSSSEQKQ